MAAQWHGQYHGQPGYSYGQPAGYGVPPQGYYQGYTTPQTNYYPQHHGQQYPQQYGYQQQQHPGGYAYQQPPYQQHQAQNWSAYQQNANQSYPTTFQQLPQAGNPVMDQLPKSIPTQMSQATGTTSAQTAIKAPTRTASKDGKVSCLNCGSEDHWAVNCPNNIRYNPPPAASTAPPPRSGPVVTKYAVPPHIAAQMKARGITGAPAVHPVSASHQYTYPTAQYPGIFPQQYYPQNFHNSPPAYGQQWQVPPIQTQALASSQPWQNDPIPAPIPGATVQQQLHVPVQVHTPPISLPATDSKANSVISPGEAMVKQGSSGSLAEAQQETSLIATSTVGDRIEEAVVETTSDPQAVKKEEESTEITVKEEQEEEEDFLLLDIPDLPKSYGTTAYCEPKLLGKPVYPLAPEWTQSGIAEVSVCNDQDGRTVSDYIKVNNPEVTIQSLRNQAHDTDPIFAVVDWDAPNSPSVSDSRDLEHLPKSTPRSGQSRSTRPTTPDDDTGRYNNRYRDRPSSCGRYQNSRSRSGTPRKYRSNYHYNHSRNRVDTDDDRRREPDEQYSRKRKRNEEPVSNEGLFQEEHDTKKPHLDSNSVQ